MSFGDNKNYVFGSVVILKIIILLVINYYGTKTRIHFLIMQPSYSLNTPEKRELMLFVTKINKKLLSNEVNINHFLYDKNKSLVKYVRNKLKIVKERFDNEGLVDESVLREIGEKIFTNNESVDLKLYMTNYDILEHYRNNTYLSKKHIKTFNYER